MSFNKQAFMKAQFQPRTAVISIPVLADFFDDNEKPEWVLRGQTANEISRAMDSSVKRKNITSVIEAISQKSEQVSEIKAAIGIHDDTPADIIKRLEQLTMCSVTPEIDLSCAVKLAETFPIEFYTLTNKILELTGLGMDLKKQKTSGTQQK